MCGGQLQRREPKGNAIVATVMSNIGLGSVRPLGIELVPAVGDKA
jgi:hypothetical protein